ncbi:hypothetical protein HY628_02290 [Candidatus Uhrbacteria bacterium]|nr:hypothetical protein [Candidatus Uhrbacteria bacterium]
MPFSKKYATPALVFLAAFTLARWFWPSPTLVDGDSFYHLKLTELLSQGATTSFPWLPFTTLAAHFTDHHLLYHFFLFPFVKLLGPFEGLLLATHLLFAILLTVFYLVARSLKFFAPLFFTGLLTLSPEFLFRADLGKAPAFSTLFVILGIYALVKGKPLLIGVLAGLYVWAHAAWPLLPFITVLWIVTQAWASEMFESSSFKMGRVFRALRSAVALRSLAAVIAGSVVGLLINPYFPHNLWFFWIQTVKIGLINYQTKINVGAEWYPAEAGSLILVQAGLFAVFLASVILLLLQARASARKQPMIDSNQLTASFSLFVIAAAFLALTLKSHRAVDYSLPFLALAAASFVTIGRPALAPAIRFLKQWLTIPKQWFLVPPLLVILLGIGLLQISFLLRYRQKLVSAPGPDAFAPVTAWMRASIPAGQIIFHSDWDNFPQLLYGDESHRYIIGLDPTFLYDRDPERYQLWHKIVYGEYVGDVTRPIKEKFQSRYVFVAKERDHDLFERQLSLSPRADKIYEDKIGLVYELH